MKCASHPNFDAVATCVDCGKGLCSDCTAAYEFPICGGCNAGRVSGEKNILMRNVILTGIFFVIGFYFANSSGGGFNIVAGIVIGYIFAGIPWGWSFLNKITPNIFLFMPIICWVIYFFLKGILSLFIGFIALPIKLIQMYRQGKRLKDITATFDKSVAS